jgi:hypothetical protein
MKVFWVFAGSQYYPGGGMQDFYDSYETEEEASAVARTLSNKEYNHDWVEVKNITKYLRIESDES